MIGVTERMTANMTATRTDRKYGYTRLVGLIGRPEGLWPSMTIYNAAFQALRLNWLCMPLPVSKGQLREALLGLRALRFAGAEVSQPYQREVLNYLEQLSPAARAIGAVRFIEVDEQGCLVGDDPRWSEFLATVRRFVPSLNGLRPLVIGAGDAAQSIVYALTHERLPVTIVDERMDQAIDLVHRLRHVLDEHSFSVYRWPQDLEQVASHANLIVNATTIGAWPDVDRSPWPDGLAFPPNALAVDLVSWPCETRFLRQARASGSKTVSGLALLVYETAMAFERWTGHPAPVELMWRVSMQTLSQQAPPELTWPENGGGRTEILEQATCITT